MVEESSQWLDQVRIQLYNSKILDDHGSFLDGLNNQDMHSMIEDMIKSNKIGIK